MNTTTPRWQDLLAKLLHQDHHESPQSEVELYQAQPALGLDLAMAWNEAMLPGVLLAEVEPKMKSRFPAAWNAARNLSLAAPFPCCVGMAPQFLQKIDGILDNADVFFQQEVTLPTAMSAEVNLENKSPLSQLAVARLAGDVALSNRLINELDGELIQKNEQAAQLWLSGNRADARQIWDDLETENPVIAFNQGLAALAAGDREHGRERLNVAVQGFEESTGWHHLAELYLAIAQ